MPELLMNFGSGISRKSRYSGVIITCWGSRLPAVNSISSVQVDCQLKRETVNATNDARNSVSTIAGTVTISELK